MKNILVIVLFVFLYIPLNAQNITSAEKKIIINLVQNAFDDIWSKYDSSKLKVHHTDDFLLLENGHLWNNDTIASYQEKGLKGPARKRVNSFDFFKFEKYGESIWAGYHNYATFTSEKGEISKAQWLESIVAIKTETGWKLKMMHSTWVPLKK